MIVPPLALVVAGCAVLSFVVSQVRREPVATASAGSLAASQWSSDAFDEFAPSFDIARIEPTGEAVIASRAAPNAAVELLHNDYVRDRTVADRSGQFVMVQPRLPPGDYELTLRSRQPDGKEARSKQSVRVTLQPKMVASPMALDKEKAGIASGQPDGAEATSKKGVVDQPKTASVSTTLGEQEDGITAYLHGDYAAALRLFQPLAEHGDASAQSNLGVMYEQGRGVAQNYREAMRWFRLAAIQGSASAQSNLGVMYYKGQGIAQDYGEAMKWYRMAAEQRNLEAQFNLGVMYEEGRGVAQNRVRAHMWFNLAAAESSDGNAKLAAKNRDLMTKSLTREQLFRAQEMAHQCEASSFKNCE
jgi:hypothetical protein